MLAVKYLGPGAQAAAGTGALTTPAPQSKAARALAAPGIQAVTPQEVKKGVRLGYLTWYCHMTDFALE